MLRNEGLKVSEIVHIGDALKGDYLIPKSIGISAILIQREEPDTEYFNKNILFSKKWKLLIVII